MCLQRTSIFQSRPFVAALLLCACFLSRETLCASCDDRQAASVATGHYIPPAPDYADSTMWFVQKNDTTGRGADVFYIVSTWEKDWTSADGVLCHYADVYNVAHRADMNREISRIAAYMGEGNDFYSPYYRHMTIEMWATQNEDTVNKYVALAMDDVRAAFQEFQRRRNPRRPFVLAGFSQGGRAVVELLKTMPADLHRYLVAAYVLGYKVTPDERGGYDEHKSSAGFDRHWCDRLLQLCLRCSLCQAHCQCPLRHVHQPRELAHRRHACRARRYGDGQRVA